MKLHSLVLMGLLSMVALGQGQDTQPQTPREITITGEVQRPGTYPFRADRITIMRVFAMSGGFTRDANRKAVQLVRIRQATQAGMPATVETIEVNLEAILAGKQADIDLNPGDALIVQGRGTRTPAPPPFFDLPDPIRKVAKRFSWNPAFGS
jgi:hypothetical protein